MFWFSGENLNSIIIISGILVLDVNDGTIAFLWSNAFKLESIVILIFLSWDIKYCLLYWLTKTGNGKLESKNDISSDKKALFKNNWL